MSAKKTAPSTAPAGRVAQPTMTVADFRRLALQLDGVEESSHMGSPDFRVGDRIFATLASQDKGYGNISLTPEVQADFVAGQPEVFLPVHGGWGRKGMTHVVLAMASEETLAGALRTAWNLRVKQNAAVAGRRRSPARQVPGAAGG
jgi:hypothetical protein